MNARSTVSSQVGSGTTRRRMPSWSAYPIRSTDINDYLAHLMGDDFSAKDFRTWHANVLAAVALAVRAPARAKTARRRAEADAMREVAEHLGNTPAVCRGSYVDPALIDAFREGRTVDPAIAGLGPLSSEPARSAAEQAVLDLLPPT